MNIDDLRTEWIDFMSNNINGTHIISLCTPDKYKNIRVFEKIKPNIYITVSVIEKYTRSVKIQYIVAGNTFEDIIYLPTSKSLATNVNDFNNKVGKKLNDWLILNNQTFLETEYKKYIDNTKLAVENLKKERIVSQREKKLKRIDGRRI